MSIRRLFSRRAFLAAAGAAPLMAAGFWEKNPFPNWTDFEVEKMLTDSPWAASMTVRFELTAPRNRPGNDFSDIGLPGGIGFPGGGQMPRGGGMPGGGGGFPSGGVPPGGQSVATEAYLTVRWSSALPIRQAMALDEHGSAAEIPSEELEALGEPQSEYIVEIFGLPSVVVHMERDEFEDELASSSLLELRSNERIRVQRVKVPAHGQYRSITLRFPRSREITLDDREVQIYAAAGPFEFRKRFKLTPMVYGGKLEL